MLYKKHNRLRMTGHEVEKEVDSYLLKNSAFKTDVLQKCKQI